MTIHSIVIAALSALLLAGCTPAAPTDAACLVLRPISYSASRDTAETVREVREHNAALLALCPNLAPRR